MLLFILTLLVNWTILCVCLLTSCLPSPTPPPPSSPLSAFKSIHDSTVKSITHHSLVTEIEWTGARTRKAAEFWGRRGPDLSVCHLPLPLCEH